jgi:hypothetical protein
VGARAEVFEAKLNAQVGKLTVAEAELKGTLSTFETSFRNLHSAFQTFIFNTALEHLMSLVHPSARVSAKATCSDVAWLDEGWSTPLRCGSVSAPIIIPPRDRPTSCVWPPNRCPRSKLC